MQMRHVCHKGSWRIIGQISRFVKISMVKVWLQQYLMNQPLDINNNIIIDWFIFKQSMQELTVPGPIHTSDQECIESTYFLDAHQGNIPWYS